MNTNLGGFKLWPSVVFGCDNELSVVKSFIINYTYSDLTNCCVTLCHQSNLTTTKLISLVVIFPKAFDYKLQVLIISFSVADAGGRSVFCCLLVLLFVCLRWHEDTLVKWSQFTMLLYWLVVLLWLQTYIFCWNNLADLQLIQFISTLLAHLASYFNASALIMWMSSPYCVIS